MQHFKRFPSMNPQLDPPHSGAVSTPTLQMRRLRVRELGADCSLSRQEWWSWLEALVYVS